MTKRHRKELDFSVTLSLLCLERKFCLFLLLLLFRKKKNLQRTVGVFPVVPCQQNKMSPRGCNVLSCILLPVVFTANVLDDSKVLLCVSQFAYLHYETARPKQISSRRKSGRSGGGMGAGCHPRNWVTEWGNQVLLTLAKGRRGSAAAALPSPSQACHQLILASAVWFEAHFPF